MAEVLRDLVVSLSLKTDNFTRNINSINRQIREAESSFRLAGAGIDNFGNTTAGMTSRLSMLQTNLGHQRDVVSQYERALASAKANISNNGGYAITSSNVSGGSNYIVSSVTRSVSVDKVRNVLEVYLYRSTAWDLTNNDALSVRNDTISITLYE